MNRERNNGQPDTILLIALVILLFIGLVMVYSSSVFYAQNAKNDQFFYFKRHFVAFVLGLIMVMVFSNISINLIKKLAPVALIFGFFLAAYQGLVVRSRWFFLGPLHFQAVDVVRLILTIYVPYYIIRSYDQLKHFSEGFFPILMVIVTFSGLTVLQRDFSSGMALFLIGMTILLAAPTRLTHVLAVGGTLSMLALGGIVLAGYNISRLEVFMDPGKDPLGKGWQIIHSLTSLGRGGITGVGFAQSREKMFYLPEAHTDFIFSIIGEEWGLIGTLLIVGLFFLILVRGIRIARRLSDPYAYFLTIGILANFMWYAIMNMMVTLQLLPPTGLPLPFISYGGTALLINMSMAGLLLNLSRQTNAAPVEAVAATPREEKVFYYHRKRKWR